MSKEIITSFYTAFQNHDAEGMNELYHELAYFSDPVFKNLTADEAGDMWRMLIERSKGDLKISFHSVEELEDDKVSCIWEADYFFGKERRPVHNVIKATMTIEDDKILIHEDQFDFWKWSKQALGGTGTLLGWTPYLKGVVRKQARSALMGYLIDKEGV